MKPMQTLVAIALAVSALPALASTPITLDFEGAESFASIGNFYNGGAGTNYGVSFTDPALALVNDELGPYFSNAPSPVTTMFVFDSTSTMNVAAGFDKSLSFSYSAGEALDNIVTVYSGLNGTGTVLGTASLIANAVGCVGDVKCVWNQAVVEFSGTAKSVVFGSGNALYDNVALAVPEPSTYAMALAGLAGLALMSRRRKS